MYALLHLLDDPRAQAACKAIDRQDSGGHSEVQIAGAFFAAVLLLMMGTMTLLSGSFETGKFGDGPIITGLWARIFGVFLVSTGVLMFLAALLRLRLPRK